MSDYMENGNGTFESISIPIDSIELPEGIENSFDLSILDWLICKNFAPSIIEELAQFRIQVVKKPKCQKRYVISGGVIPYMCLLKAGYSGSVWVVFRKDVVDLEKAFSSDIALWTFILKAGSVANAIKATVLNHLFDFWDKTSSPFAFLVTKKHVMSGNLLKDISGYDSRAFKRSLSRCADLPEKILRKVIDSLLISGCLGDSLAATSQSTEENKVAQEKQ